METTIRLYICMDPIVEVFILSYTCLDLLKLPVAHCHQFDRLLASKYSVVSNLVSHDRTDIEK